MAADLQTMRLADALQRIKQTELALVRSEEMVAENLAMCSRIRSARRRVMKPGGRLATIDPTSPKEFAQ
ncbi:hypothetical protein FJV76_04900 [Mesorhizobium sp. WSM4303]|uniref:hypothetical protein n=1 Tax=unclassified Mesorhizobium TaxID=325217 RepID=UPI00115D22CC|nr:MULTISPECIES: hypothetical protein [unclassified Mesorhizobium]TRD00376.1 hypothetical protein FJV77_00580 [Mesorhizobium sp. WSM4306]TRD07681.1 hypothetical protein FJV76_04900 [Mesorhizobium sp. WSM4303]